MSFWGGDIFVSLNHLLIKKTSALETAYKDADASLKENIAAQQKALEQAREELTSEYEKAISEAVVPMIMAYSQPWVRGDHIGVLNQIPTTVPATLGRKNQVSG